MAAQHFPRLVTLACHDLRTPLATVNGFAKTLLRNGELDDQTLRFLGLIDAAGEQIADLLDLLALAARIEAGTYEPLRRQVDTLALVTFEDGRVTARGDGEPAVVDESALRRSFAALSSAALRHGELERVEWTVHGRELTLAPINAGAAKVISGEDPKDLGALVARIAIENTGAELRIENDALTVEL